MIHKFSIRYFRMTFNFHKLCVRWCVQLKPHTLMQRNTRTQPHYIHTQLQTKKNPFFRNQSVHLPLQPKIIRSCNFSLNESNISLLVGASNTARVKRVKQAAIPKKKKSSRF